MALADEKYMSLTTFKRDGTPVPTPVWVVGVGDDQVGFWTSSESGKAKRLRHTDRVIVQASDARGRAKDGSEPIEATAEVVTGERLDEVAEAVRAKYGFMTKLTKVFGTIGGIVKRNRIPYGDVAVIVTLPSG